jgi:hypothetical protein
MTVWERWVLILLAATAANTTIMQIYETLEFFHVV